MKEKRAFIRNVLFAFAAQGISLLLSVLMSLIVPKILDVNQYAYWQLFVFYVGYVGFSHLGLTDGVYLKIGGAKYDDLDYSLYKSQLAISLLFQTIIAIAVTCVVWYLRLDTDRTLIIVLSLIYMLIFNAAGYFGYIFQAVNETHMYSTSIIIDRLIFIAAVLVACFVPCLSYRYFILFYIISKTVALLYCICHGWKLAKAPLLFSIRVWKELCVNIAVGSKLLLANIASTLILGVGRITVDSVWGLTAFGQISFSLSLTSFFLQFISQISMVLFPALRQVDRNTQEKMYTIIRTALGGILPLAFVVYYPMKIMLGNWLPEYTESLHYLAYLLPICTYDGKMQLLCNTYFKVLRKEHWLLYINLLTAGLSVILCSFGAYLFHSVFAVMIGMVVSIAVRSIVAEFYLAKLMHGNVIRKLGEESLLVIVFMFTNFFLDEFVTWILFLCIYGGYLYVNRKEVYSIANTIRK